MPRYRKKPVEIEAESVQVLCSTYKREGRLSLPAWFTRALDTGVVRIVGENEIHIDTREGTLKGYSDDMLIQGIEGELYPCGMDIFNKTYEAA